MNFMYVIQFVEIELKRQNDLIQNDLIQNDLIQNDLIQNDMIQNEFPFFMILKKVDKMMKNGES